MEAEIRNQCDLCEEEFGDMERLIIHKETHQREHIFVCSSCYKAFSQLTDLKQHSMGDCGEGKSEETSMSQTYICDTCDSVKGSHGLDSTEDSPDQDLNSINKFSRHKLNEFSTAHGINVRDELLPDIDLESAEKILSAEGLGVSDKHLPDDGLVSIATPGLNVVEEIVSENDSVSATDRLNNRENKPYVCEVCSAAFNDRNELNQHNETHCDRSNKSIVHVEDPIENSSFVHNPQNYDSDVDKRTRACRKSFVCPVCFLTFSEGNEWNDHKKAHSVKREKHSARTLATNSSTLRVSTHPDDDDAGNDENGDDGDDSDEGDDDNDTAVDDDIDADEQTLAGKSHPCYQCNSSFTEASELTMHLVAHSVDQLLQCVFCDEQFKSKNQLFKHMRSHDNEDSYTCEQCDKTSDTISAFISHIRTHLAEQQFKCNYCGTSFSRRNHVVKHMRLHSGEKPFQCTKCDKAFAYKGSLKKHMQIHGEERPYQCDECDKAFKAKSSLRQHQRVHTGDKPFQCEICLRTFSRKEHWMSHTWTHSYDKPFKCELCDKSFSQKSGLMQHEITHSGEKPHECDVCGKTFTQKGSLNCHMEVHNDRRPFECDHCHKSFRRKYYLKLHQVVHSGEKAHVCCFCNNAYRFKYDLTRHIKTAHSRKRTLPMLDERKRRRKANKYKAKNNAFVKIETDDDWCSLPNMT